MKRNEREGGKGNGRGGDTESRRKGDKLDERERLEKERDGG
jgi:hypothetical protein